VKPEVKVIKKVVILINESKQGAVEFAKEVKLYFTQKKIESIMVFGVEKIENIELDSSIDLAICLGGDGTVLSCARLLHSHGIPMLAVNLGTFGFITEVCKTEWKEAYEYYEKGLAEISRRLMIRVSVIRDSNRIYVAHGLNEMTVTATGISKMVSLDLFVNGTNAGRIRSDGIIVSTPTGSTGYSLAAGGPILDVNLNALIINPICPFTLSNRPIVVQGEDIIKIGIREGQNTQLSLTIDGQLFYPLLENDLIEIQKSHSRALLVVSPKRNFYEVVRDKLNWSGGMHA